VVCVMRSVFLRHLVLSSIMLANVAGSRRKMGERGHGKRERR